MDTAQLEAFDRVVREGGFSRAAWALGIAQATVSARVQALEADVGGALFVRGRHTRLTPRGEQFLDYARRALDLLDTGVRRGDAAAGDCRQQLTVGVSASLAGGVFAATIGEFHRSHPKVAVQARTADCDEIVRLVREGLFGLGFIPWPMVGVKDLQSLWTFVEPLTLVAHPRHPLARDVTWTLEDAARLADPLYSAWFDGPSDKLLAPVTTERSAAIELPLQTILTLVKSGVGASFMTQLLVAEDIAAGRLAVIRVDGLQRMHRRCALVRSRQAGRASQVEQAFAAIVKTVAHRSAPIV